MSLLALSGTNSVSGGYDIDNSLKVEPDNTEYLVKTPSSDGNRRTFTISLWLKRTELGAHMTLFGAQPSSSWTNGNTFQFGFTNDDTFQCGLQTFYVVQTNRVFRDTSAWYHVVVAVDTTQSTVANRFKLYINGVQETSWLVDQIYGISQNQDLGINHTTRHQIGRLIQNGWGFAGYIAEMHNVDGQQLAPTSFGEFDDDSGIWKPKAYTGTYGTNGFYLDFADAADLGDDESGNGNDYTENNIAAADQATDTPTNNFATGNPLLYFSTATTVSEGATKIAKGANGWEMLASTMAVTKGKWYVEVRNETMPESAMASIMPDDIELIFRGGQITNYPGKIVGDEGQGYYSYNGKYYRNGGFEDYGASWTGSANTIGIALDMDNGKLYFAKDNTWQNSGDPTSGSTGTGAIDVLAPTKPHLIGYTPYAANTDGFINFGGFTGAGISSGESDANGYGNFEYAPPSGYYALCTKNLAEYG